MNKCKESPHDTEALVQSLGQEDPLEKETVTHSSICLENSMDPGAWWAAQLIGPQRVGHD